MGAKAESTREKILAAAEYLVLNRGFSATSIEDVIEAAEISKGGFFYHFDNKTELARGLLERYLEQDERITAQLLARADELSDDPLERLLIFIKLFAEMLEGMETTHPGCLVASYCYESQQFDEDIRQLAREGIEHTQRVLAERIEAVSKVYPPVIMVSSAQVADMMISLLEGGIIMGKTMEDRSILPEMILKFRDYLRLLYAKVPATSG